MNTFYCIVGFGLIVWGYHSYKSFRLAQKEELDEILESMVYHTAHLTLTREENGIVYAYDQNGKFAGQGKTKEELVAHVKLNLPGKNIYASLSEMQKVGFDVK